MKKIAERLRKITDEYGVQLNLIDAHEYAAKPDINKWSKKEILGHLIDSAQTNIRRFVVAQYEEAPLISYDQEKWVVISHYQLYKIGDLLALWVLLNKHICIILSNTSEESSERICKTNNQTEHTIGWLAEDYIRHLLHHLSQICNGKPIPYP